MPRFRIACWALYDFANTMFTMNVVTLYFSVWLTVDQGKTDLWVGAANGAAAAVVLILLPALGAWSDAGRRKVALLGCSTALCCLATAGIGLLATPAAGVACFVVAVVAFHAGQVFYNALLRSVAPEGAMGRVSGLGIAAGYAGAIVGVIVVMPFATGRLVLLEVPALCGPWEQVAELDGRGGTHVDTRPGFHWEYEIRQGSARRPAPARDGAVTGDRRRWTVTLGDAPAGATLWRRRSGLGRAATFVPTALLFAVFALPCLLFVRERAGDPVEPSGPGAWARAWRGLGEARRQPGVARYLAGKFFFEVPISTIAVFLTVYAGRVLGFDDATQQRILVAAAVCAIAGAAGAGACVDRWGARATLIAVLAGWVVLLAAALFARGAAAFWILGPGYGALLGALWAGSRPLLASLASPGRQGAYFGLSELVGKLAAVLGPPLWGAIVWGATSAGWSTEAACRAAFATLTVFMAAGAVILGGPAFRRPFAADRRS